MSRARRFVAPVAIWQRAVVIAGVVAAGAACSGSAKAPGSGGVAGSGSAATGTSVCSSGCTDAYACTVDSCVAGGCRHSIGPTSGATACPPKQYCTVEKGCVASPACANDQQCMDVWKGDACKANPRCDAASSVCIFDQLDKDNDGHAPQVCGGDDCDDSNPNVYPGASELCNGKDDDCDGEVDNATTCPSGVCFKGTCHTDCDTICGGNCINTKRDASNCGGCQKACPTGAPNTESVCFDGVCTPLHCVSGHEDCNGDPGDGCEVNTQSPQHCGGCDIACISGATCDTVDLNPSPGTSVGCACCSDWTSDDCQQHCLHGCRGGADCMSGQTCCNGVCADEKTDTRNCGACGTQCTGGDICQSGTCVCLGSVCNGTCVDTSSDTANCGACGMQCAAAEVCQGGTCVCSGSICNGTCVDTSSDDTNCGACGVSCTNGKSCQNGSCHCVARGMGTAIAGCSAADTTAAPSALEMAAHDALADASLCGSSSCHSAPSPRVGLDFLDAADLKAALVGKMACEAPNLPLVDPSGGDDGLNCSYVWVKLTAPVDLSAAIVGNSAWGTDLTCGQQPSQPYGIRMPMTGTNVLLETSRLAAVRNWICAGAPGP